MGSVFAQEEGKAVASEAIALAPDSKVQFYKPCPENSRLGYVAATVEPENLVMNARCVGDTGTSSVTTTVPNTLLQTNESLVLERIPSRFGLYEYLPSDENQLAVALIGDEKKSCTDIVVTAQEKSPSPKFFMIGLPKWENRIRYLVDSGCKVVAVQINNWLAVLPANRTDSFKLDNYDFVAKPGEYVTPPELLKETILTPSPKKLPKGAKLLNKKGMVQIFQPCSNNITMFSENVVIDPEYLIIDVWCVKGAQGDWKTLKLPNTIMETDRRIVFDSLYTISGTYRSELIAEKDLSDGKFGERTILKRQDGSLCSQMDIEIKKILKYPEYLRFSQRDPRESLGYYSDSECRFWVLTAGNLIAIVPTDTEEHFKMHGIEYIGTPLQPIELISNEAVNAQN